MNPVSLNLENPIRDAISRIRFAPHSNNLLVSSWDSSLRLYDVDNSKLRMDTPGEAALLDCCFENEGCALLLLLMVQLTGQIITAGWDKKINFWDVRSTQSLGCLNSLVSEVESMSLSGLNLMVAAGSSVNIYDIRSFKTSVHTKGIKVKCIRPIFNPKGFVVGSIDGRVLLEYFCKSSSNEGYAFRCYPKVKDGRRHLVTVNDIAFNPSVIGSFITGDNDGYATLWDARGRKRIFEMSRYPNSVVSLSYSHDGLLLAVASSYSYQEANEIEEPPQIFIHEMGNCDLTSPSCGASNQK
ncbi:unnamed protein product [Withania somnifera]